MLNIVWLAMLLISLFFGIINGTLPAVVEAVTTSADAAVKLALGLVGIMSFWLGIMHIAEQSGLLVKLSHALRPLFRRLFPDVPDDHPAVGHITMNMAANMFGIANAATPFGLRAMEALETLNQKPGTATDSMCMFLAINTSSVQLIPVTGMVFLAVNGAKTPTDIIITALLATLVSTIVGVTGALIGRRRANKHIEEAAS